MRFNHLLLLLLLVGLMVPSVSRANDKAEREKEDARELLAHRKLTASLVPLKEVLPAHRNRVAMLLEKAPIYSRGSSESFPCQADAYRWLLDNSDACLYAWRTMGATKANITRQADGSFTGSDGSQAEMTWRQVWAEEGCRVWTAEGGGRPAPFLPEIKVQAVVVIRYSEVTSVDGRKGIRHRVEVFADHDTKPGLFSKISGITPELIAKKATQQVELFFSGMAWYACDKNEWAKTTFSKWASTEESKLRVQSFLVTLEQCKKVDARSVSRETK